MRWTNTTGGKHVGEILTQFVNCIDNDVLVIGDDSRFTQTDSAAGKTSSKVSKIFVLRTTTQ